MLNILDPSSWPKGKYKFGDWVCKNSGSSWHGQIVGWYSTSFTSIGYAVESYYEPGSVQIYPEKALIPWTPIGLGDRNDHNRNL